MYRNSTWEKPIFFIHRLSIIVFLLFSFGNFYIENAYAESGSIIHEVFLNTPSYGPEDLILDSNNHFWTSSTIAGKVSQISENGEVIRSYSADVFPRIANGPDGSIWFTEYSKNKIGKIDKNGILTEYLIPTSNAYPLGITAGNDGNMWFTEYIGEKIGRITPDGNITDYYVSYGPHGITAGPDGSLWYAGFGSNLIGVMNTDGFEIEFVVPTGMSKPENITYGPDGNMWFTEKAGNNIGKITPSGKITEFPVPTANSYPNYIVAGNDGHLYFTETEGNKIGRISTNGLIQEFDIPTPNSQPMGITNGPDGQIWFSERAGNSIAQLNTEMIPYITPSPTQAVSPTPTPQSLNVPLYKQGNSPYTDNNPIWESDIFDHAVGQFTCGTTMAQCGCSTTSIAMVFKAHGIDTMPDGRPLTPGTLNEWLKNNNGYNRDLGVDWAAAARLTKLAKSQNPNFHYDALEFKYDGVYQDQLRTDLDNGMPTILEVPGHYIVATNTDNETFAINDPYYNRTSLAAYNNNYVSVRKYIPSHTDLSYITLVVDKDIDISLKNSAGEEVGDVYFENAINDPTSGQEFSTVKPIAKIISFSKPPADAYRIEISSSTPRNFELDIKLIDQEGNDAAHTIAGITSQDATAQFELNYSSNSVNSSSIRSEMTFMKFKGDIKSLYALGKIKNKIVYASLMLQANTAEKASILTRQPLGNNLAVLVLKSFIFELNKVRGKSLSEDAYQILKNDAQLLIQMIQGDTGGSSGGGT